jgi:O-antigen/teichoic acid export membrane protein
VVTAYREGRLGSALAALPVGTIPVGIGLLVSGIAAYSFQILAFRILGSEPYAALNGLWVTAFVLAPGVFLPLEQEVARALAHRNALGQGGRPLVLKAIVLGVALSVAVVAVVLVLRDPIESRLLRDSDGLFAVLIVVLIGFAIESLTRGTLSGNSRFGRYGIVVGVDGAARPLLAGAIAIVGFETLGWFGVAFALAPYIASLCGLIGVRGLLEPGPPAPMSELSTAIGWLLLGSTFAQALGYSAYIGASMLATSSQDAELGAFIAGLFIARIPLLLFQAVQAALLPKLASLLGHGRIDEFRRGFTQLIAVVAIASVVGTLLALTAGPMIGRLLFGPDFTLSGIGLAALTAGCSLVVIALTFAQALIALRRYVVTAVSWVVGVGIFLIIMFMPISDVFTRAEVAFLVGAAVSATILAYSTTRALRGMNANRV